MKLFLISDVHVDEWQCNKATLPDSCYPQEHVDVAVLAGDIGEMTANCTAEYVNTVALHADLVLWVPGNHEYYKRYIGAKPKQSVRSNVRFMNNEWIDVDNYRFVCSTMWTFIPPHAEIDVSNRMTGLRDYQKIRTHDFRKLTPAYINSIHCNSVNFMDDVCTNTPPDTKTIVITHHKPYVGKPPYGNPKPTDYAYHVNMIDKMEAWKIDHWFYGHTHENCDLDIVFDKHTTKIKTRALGYSLYHNTGLDHHLEI